MRHYQIFPFSAEGRLSEAVARDFENDTRAIRHVIEGGFPNGCELWEGFRFVGRFHGAAEVKPIPRRPTRERTLVH